MPLGRGGERINVLDALKRRERHVHTRLSKDSQFVENLQFYLDVLKGEILVGKMLPDVNDT